MSRRWHAVHFRGRRVADLVGSDKETGGPVIESYCIYAHTHTCIYMYMYIYIYIYIHIYEPAPGM